MIGCVKAYNWGEKQFYTVDVPYGYDHDLVYGVREALALSNPSLEGHSFRVDPWDDGGHRYVIIFTNNPAELSRLTKELVDEYRAGRLLPWRFGV